MIIEYAHKAIKSENLTTLAIRGKDCVVAVSEKKMPVCSLFNIYFLMQHIIYILFLKERLIEPSTVRHIFNVTKHIGVLFTGIQGFFLIISKLYLYNFIICAF